MMNFQKFSDPSLPQNVWVWTQLCETQSAAGYYRRNQLVNKKDDCFVDATVGLNNLPGVAKNSDGTVPKLWFHATDWDAAKSILADGPRLNGKNSDFSRHGAYYLNDNYSDSYEWLWACNDRFRGRHAILVYQFDRSNLECTGIDLTRTDEWRSTVFSCIGPKQTENKLVKNMSWVYGPQCSNPTYVRKSSATPMQRKIGNELAMQFAIRNDKTLAEIRSSLVGVICFENISNKQQMEMEIEKKEQQQQEQQQKHVQQQEQKQDEMIGERKEEELEEVEDRRKKDKDRQKKRSEARKQKQNRMDQNIFR